MIGQSRLELVFIGACIITLRLITPICLLYLYACFVKKELLLSPWIFAYASLEVGFYYCVFVPRQKELQEHASHSPPPLTKEQRQELFRRCSEHVSETTYPLGWFTSPEVMRENVVEWLLWALFSCKPEENSQEWKEEIDEYVRKVEELVGRKFEDGRLKDVSAMRLTFDEVKMNHRPLVWYMIVGIVDHLTAARLWLLGFRHYSPEAQFRMIPSRLFTALSEQSATPVLSYWYRPHRSSDRDPIVFIHGIGIGLHPYIPFISDLVKSNPDVGILLIELLPVSMRITSQRMPPRPVMIEAIYQTMASLKISRATLASHSYGTVISAHIIRSLLSSPQTDSDSTPVITSHLLIDPIPILLHLPDVAYNFLYRDPQQANEWQLWYFASRDPDIAHTLGRHFFWAENVLWKDDLVDEVASSPTPAAGASDAQKRKSRRPPVAVVLSGKDQIVRAADVRRYLTGEDDVKERWINEQGSLEVLYYPELDHAMVFDKKEKRRGMIRILDRFTANRTT